MRAIVTSLAVTFALAACGRAATPVDRSGVEEPTILRLTLIQDDSGPVYIEGALHFVHITGSGEDLQQQLDPTTTRIELPAGGDYHLESWARPCDGNCGSLDDPTDRCETDLTAPAGTTLDVEITVPAAEPCTIALTN